MLIQSGVTENGKRVFRNVYRFMSTHGVPLEVILHRFKEKNCVVDWLDFWDAMSLEVDPAKVHLRMKMAIEECYGEAHMKQWNATFMQVLELREKKCTET